MSGGLDERTHGSGLILRRPPGAVSKDEARGADLGPPRPSRRFAPQGEAKDAVVRFLFSVLALLLLSLPAFAAEPVVPKAKGGVCVEESQAMRRNHMEFLKHQRDATLRQGERDGKHSLKACVSCHETEGKAINAPGQFCQSCHTYAAVSIDCFSCHATQSAQSQSAKGNGP